jgi:hypothetical protein
MAESEWTREDFTRRQYVVEQSEARELDKAKRIGVRITIDGRVFLDKQMRVPGMVAIISRPDHDGFVIEFVERNTEPGMGPRYSDIRAPGTSVIHKMADWMFKALGL